MPRGYDLPSRRLVSQEDASMIDRPGVPRSKFTGTFSKKLTFDAGLLVPFHVEEVLPGDHFKYRFTPLVRTATPFFPIMDTQRIDIHCFFVPNRLVWENWVRLQGQQNSPGDSIAFSVPQVLSTGNGFAVGGVGDYMGLPTVGQPIGQLEVSVLPFRAYNAIYNAWYRDENLVNAASFSVTDGGFLSEANYPIRRRAKSHDRFTSALPWPQKFVSPSIVSPVTGIGVDVATPDIAGPVSVKETPWSNNPTGLSSYTRYFDSDVDRILIQNSTLAGMQVFAQTDVNLFRSAMQVQVFLERMARGGTRYTEILENIWNVRNPDARLQRPEYIGGGSTPLRFTPIPQTGTGGAGLGALGAAGTAVGNNSASYAATEHGFIFCIMSVKSELSYSQGVHPMWDRRTLYDYPNPAFMGLGEAAILRRQIFCNGDPVGDALVFGYQERWQEYRTHESTVHGLFRPTAAGNIDEWHLSQLFSPAPTLGQTFIEDTPPMSRVLSAGVAANGMQYLADVHISVEMVRPVSLYGTPVGLGRF